MREKGTNRTKFFRGQIDKYTWVDIGSSYLPGELMAAFLSAQMEEADKITRERLKVWKRYHELFKPFEAKGILRRPIVPENCQHNAHMYYILLKNTIERQSVMETLKNSGIYSVFHYVPLHSSPAGIKYGRALGALPNTDRLSASILRLPLWIGLKTEQQLKIVEVIQGCTG